MVRKIGIVIIVLGIAAFSPAPINDSIKNHPKRVEQSQAQLTKQQQFNGVVPVVGQIPLSVNEVGMERDKSSRHSIEHEGEGESSMTVGTNRADKVGNGATIVEATNRVEQEVHGSKYLWLYGLIIATLGFGGWKLFQYKIEKSMPVPEFSKRFLKEFENGNS